MGVLATLHLLTGFGIKVGLQHFRLLPLTRTSLAIEAGTTGELSLCATVAAAPTHHKSNGQRKDGHHHQPKPPPKQTKSMKLSPRVVVVTNRGEEPSSWHYSKGPHLKDSQVMEAGLVDLKLLPPQVIYRVLLVTTVGTYHRIIIHLLLLTHGNELDSRRGA